jgi:CRP-like cAMP-binding protein
MKKYLNVIKKSPLFSGVGEYELMSMLTCLSARMEHYRKNQFVFRRGESVSALGMVLSGSVHVIKEDFWGNQTILGMASAGQLFAETFSLQAEPLGVSVIAMEQSEVLFLDVRKITTSCSSACEFHTKLIRNLFSVLAEKNLLLTKKLEHMAQRTTREKLLSYLSAESQKSGSPAFEIPFNRQQLADYLSVDRSAMSNELCKLRKEGVLVFQKNSFELKEQRN